MSNQPAKEQASIKTLLQGAKVQERFNQILGEKSQQFISAVIQVVNQSRKLQQADPNTVLTAASEAAALDLSINPNLGHAYIIPYYDRHTDTTVAQFQVGYKGYIQLAQRTGLYRSIIGIPVYKCQFKSWDPLTETLEADFLQEPDPKNFEIVGFVAGFELVGGFRKIEFWSKSKVDQHKGRFSKSHSLKNSIWNTDYKSMAIKTVLKSVLSKFGPLEIDSSMARAVKADQAVIEGNKYRYLDNPSSMSIEELSIAKERKRIEQHIEQAATIEDLQRAQSSLQGDEDLISLFDNKMLSLTQNQSTNEQ